ncbi:MAG: hypothetical protein K0S71_2234 [Clostridia bacterium]|jgi:methyl-accepting chemotaxis protein|nr:hypothetical protein [Clostridia bacterium]
MKKTSTLTFKIAVILIPSFLIGLVIFNYLIHSAFGDTISALVTSRTENTKQEIEATLQASGGLSNLLAETVENADSSLTQEQYQAILESYVAMNDTISGSGVWYEPYKYDKNRKFFGPYVYRDGDQFALTLEYEADDYNYPEQDWYKKIVAADGKVAWTSPYYDEATGGIFITTGRVIKNEAGELLGVITVDLDIAALGAKVNDWVIGEKGKTFLLSQENQYIANSSSDQIMTSIVDDSDKILATAGGIISNNQEVNYHDNNFHGYIFDVIRIEGVDWKIGSLVSRNEFFGIVTTTIIGISLLMFVLLIVVFAIIGSIIKMVKSILVATEEIQQGNLTLGFSSRRNDEFGLLTTGLNKMITSFREIVTNIVSLSNEVKNKSGHTMQYSIDMQNIAKSQADALGEITVTMNEMTSAIGEVVGSANELALIMDSSLKNGEIAKANAQEAVNISEKGKKDMDKITAEMAIIRESVSAMSNSVLDAGNSAEEIRNIIKFIENVATQTNLLALNAAIEAARAGEAGRGFSVVADEIRKLAESTTTSTKQISDLVEKVINVTHIAVNETNKNVHDINSSATLINDTGIMFENILSSTKNTYKTIQTMIDDVDKINLVAQDLVSTTEEQSAGTEEILATVENVNGMSSNLLLNTEKVVDNAKELHTVANTLECIVSTFKITS